LHLLRRLVRVAHREATYLKGRHSMETDRKQPPRDDREQYEPPTGMELGKVEELTGAIDAFFPSGLHQ
jgi:hypothetical protein